MSNSLLEIVKFLNDTVVSQSLKKKKKPVLEFFHYEYIIVIIYF